MLLLVRRPCNALESVLGAQILVTVLIWSSVLLIPSGLAHVHHDHDDEETSLSDEDWNQVESTNSIERLLKDQRIVALQSDRRVAPRLEVLRIDPGNWRNLNELGWLLASQARTSQDESYYGLSERAATLNLELNGRRPETLALWIHSSLQGHHFGEARKAAEELVAIRGESIDYALRGDAAMEQGDLAAAEGDYLEFLKRSPSLPSYARWGHLNWLLGNDDVAISAWREAIEQGRQSDNESVAWCKTKLAEIYLYRGNLDEAGILVDEALSWNIGYAQARYVKGKIDWFLGDVQDAVEGIKYAVDIDPLPEREWWLEDVYRRLGYEQKADELRERIIEYGPSTDRRATSLYLSTHGYGKGAALKMAQAELANRADAATLDAVGYCLLQNGHIKESETVLLRSTEKGRAPGRLPFHLGMLAWARGDADTALTLWNRAFLARYAMTPSEIEVLKMNLAKVNAAISGKYNPFAKGYIENE